MAPRGPLFPVYPPRIESLESADLALAEIGRLDALAKHVAADVEDRTAAIVANAKERLMIDAGAEEPLTLADWRAQLEGALEKFCTKHRDNLVEEGKQSRTLNHGTFGWRKQKAALESLEDFPAGGNPKLLDTLLAELRNKLQALAKFFEKGSARFVDLKLAWRKSELLKAAKDQEITPAELKKAGFELDDPGERFFVDVATAEVKSQSAEKP